MEDDGLWNGDDLLAGRLADDERPASAFGDEHLGTELGVTDTYPRSSLVPTTARRRGGGAGWSESWRWFTAALLAAVAILVTLQLLPAEEGVLEIQIAQPERHPEIDVFVDGVKRCGATPCVLQEVAAGGHVVELVTRDGERLRQDCRVRAGEHNLVSLAVASVHRRPRIGQGVELRSPLSHLRVSVDGRRRGTLPILIDDLAPGEHRLHFEAPGRRPHDQTVTVRAGEVLHLHDIELALAKGRLVVDLKSPGARVLLGRRGKRRGRRPLYGPWPKSLDLETATQWELVAGGPGYRPAVFPVTFDEEGRARVEVRLELAGWTGMETADDLYE